MRATFQEGHVGIAGRRRDRGTARQNGLESMGATLLVIAVGCLLGAIQFAAGFALGLRLRAGRSCRGLHAPDANPAEHYALRLHSLADDMSSSVGEHRTYLEEAGRLLSATTSRNEAQLADLAANVIGNVVGANRKLQARLESAEVRLQEQATEIEAHMSRALTDSLTGLPNRREFDQRLEASLANWRKRGVGFTLLMLDVDRFKQLNDRFGHVAGDHVLAKVADALRRNVRETDFVARFGGEEFAILFPATSLDAGLLLTRHMLLDIARATILHHGVNFRITLSGGLAEIGGNEEGAELLRRADAALYAAKNAGRNCAFAHDGERCIPLSELLADLPPELDPLTDAGDERLESLLGMIETLFAPTGASTDPSSNRGGVPELQMSRQLAAACLELRQFVESRSATRRNVAPLASRDDGDD